MPQTPSERRCCAEPCCCRAALCVHRSMPQQELTHTHISERIKDGNRTEKRSREKETERVKAGREGVQKVM